MSTLEQALQIGVALDPMKPLDMVAPPGIASAPPTCPMPGCGALLHPVRQNIAGDQFFECLNGDLSNAGHYSAIYRVATGAWEQHPAFKRDDWVAPNQRKLSIVPQAAKATKTKTKAKRKRK